jgi:sterol O-acyltransferase
MKRLERARELLVLAQEEECEASVIQELTDEIDFCVDEVNAQSSAIAFPDNITLWNYFQYSMFPTLVYQIEYPRTSHFRLGYFLKKTAATFGTYWCMIFVAEEFLYPAAMCAMDLRDQPLIVKAKAYPLVVLDLIPPFVVMYLLVFYIIWDAILNGLAELTYFGDREFYGEWWNSVTWDQFAKDWNVPVHRFLLRHVYHSSMSALHVSKQGATSMSSTFFLSLRCVY